MENSLEKFVMESITRDQIQGAPYNPRKITDDARKKLKKELLDLGLLGPITVNRRTMNVVSGHQRLGIMDTVLKSDTYPMNVAMVDLDDVQEVRANILMNNSSVQGEWDEELLQEIKVSFPEIDFQKDLGFDMLDIQHIFAGSDAFAEVENLFAPSPAQADVFDMAAEAARVDKVKAARKNERDMRKSENRSEDDYQAKNDNYTLTMVFENNSAKEEFCSRARIEKKETRVKATILYDIADGKINLRGIKE